MNEHTKGPWQWFGTRSKPNSHAYLQGLDFQTILCDFSGSVGDNEYNARLIASAPDHAAIARVLVSGQARWEATTSEFCVGGLRYSTKIDEFGVPEMTNGMRAAIAKAMQS